MLIPRGEAVISDCGKYRPWLTRPLGGEIPLVSIGANPSVADADRDDQTMRKEQGYARAWGCGLLIKVNIYPWRATDPDDMWAAQKRGEDIYGNGMMIGGVPYSNVHYILRAVELAQRHRGIILGAWGNIGEIAQVRGVVYAIEDMGAKIQCLGTNANGSPKHTLYLKKTLTPQPWSMP